MTQSLALLDFLNPENILNWLGPLALIGVIFIIFAECGLLIGFFLPGDSLLFITGLFIAQGYINTPIWLAALLLAAAAVIGNATGYWIGYKAGPKLFNRPDSQLFRKEYVDKTHEFFERYGPRAVVLARFVPIVRTFITAMAGVGRMDFRIYMTYSAIGGILWGAGVTFLGYGLGNVVFVKDHIELILLAVVAISLLPIVFEYVKHKREAAARLPGRGRNSPRRERPAVVFTRAAASRPGVHACCSAHAYIAMAAAAPALIDRVDPYWVMCRTGSQIASDAGLRPGPSWPNRSTHACGSNAASSGTDPGTLSMPRTGSPDAPEPGPRARRGARTCW